MLFTFPSRYWSAIGLSGVFSLAGWSRRIHAGFLVSRATQDTTPLRLASRTRLSRPVAALSSAFRSPSSCVHVVLLPSGRRNVRSLGSSPFARHYWGNHSYFLFLRVLRCFSSPRSPSPYEGECHVFNMTGCPIRKSADQRPFAPPRGFSQLITSFIASESQGIRHVPFFPFTSPRTGVPCGWIYFRLPPYRAGCLYCHTMS